MIYQIRWLNYLLNHKKLKLSSPHVDKNIPEYIVKCDEITDDKMVMNRKYLFRPNFQHYIAQRKIKIQ
jgi:hypothetical protein